MVKNLNGSSSSSSSTDHNSLAGLQGGTTGQYYHLIAPAAPNANLLNIPGVANGDTTWNTKALFDATNPADCGTAAPGSAVVAARRDHVHKQPTAAEVGAATTATLIDAFGVAGTSNTDRDANTTNHGLLLKAVAGASAGFAKAVVCLYGQTIYSLQELYDATVPEVLGTASAGSATTLARRDHVHSAELKLADGKSVELKKALGTDHTGSGVTATLTAHETTTLFQVGFINGSGKVALADSDAASTMPVRAMAMAGISADAAGIYMLKGFVIDASWSWTVGGILYASGTPGAMTQTAPTGMGKVVQAVGVAITATIVYFDPSLTWLELS